MAKIIKKTVYNDEENYADIYGATMFGDADNKHYSSNGLIQAERANAEIVVVKNIVAQTVETQNAKIDSLEATKASVEDLEAANAEIENLIAESAEISALVATKADISALDAETARVDTLLAGKANINLANVNNAWIENGVLKDASVSDAKIIGVSANKLTAGTIDASNITVTNLNADNITTGTINGQRIGDGSLSLEKLSDAVYTENEIDSMLSTMQDEIDGAIETFTSDTIPTLNNYPASDWKVEGDEEATYELRHKHVGDVCYVVNSGSQSDGYCYRFTESSSHAFTWELIKDSDVTAALQRLIDAEGDISDLQTFESTTSSWITNTDSELNSLKTRTSAVETSLGDKVSTSTFNELSQTVEENTSSITSLSETVSTKADSSTVTSLSNTVNSVSQKADANESSISNLTTTVSDNKTSIEARASRIEQDLSGFKTTVSETYSTKDDLEAVSDDVSSLSSRVTSAESSISQNATNISAEVTAREGLAESTTARLELKANKATLTSEINATADTVKIDANKVNISGVITAINNDTTTTIDGGKITTNSITIGALDNNVSNNINTALSIAEGTLIYDHTYAISNGIATFTAYLYRGGEDIKSQYEAEQFTWYYYNETVNAEMPLNKNEVGGVMVNYGYTIPVPIDEMGYGTHIIGKFTMPNDAQLLTEDDDTITTSNDLPMTARTSSGESVRVSELSVSTTLYASDKVMVVGGEDEHLVTIQTLQEYLNANLEKQVLFNTTSGWNSQPSLVSKANTLYVYTDHEISGGQNVAGIKAGDGSAYVIDLPFTDAVLKEHINDTTVHVTNSDRTFWNNKVRCYYAGTENLIFTTT